MSQAHIDELNRRIAVLQEAAGYCQKNGQPAAVHGIHRVVRHYNAIIDDIREGEAEEAGGASGADHSTC